MTNTARIVLAAILTIGSAFGQEGVSLMADINPVELREALNLNDDQIDRLRKNVTAMFAEVDPLAKNLYDKEVELMRERTSDAPNEALIGKITVEVDAIRKQLEAVQSRFQASARAVLTAAQRKELVPIEEAAKRIGVAFEAAELNLVTIKDQSMASLGSFGDAGTDEISEVAEPGSKP